VPLEPVGGEHLVPVVADPAGGPAVPAPARQAHRVGMGRPEERLGRGERQSSSRRRPVLSGQAGASDVHGLGVVGGDDASQAQVQAEPPQGPEPRGQPVDLQVPVQRLLADAAGRLPCGIEPVGQVGDRPLEALAMAAKCCSSVAIRAGSALGARWSRRSNALVVRGFT
jgi:hypothetical protein